MTAPLCLERVEKRFGALQAVEPISLEFRPGRVHAVLGENGAGKSTLLKIAAGLLQPTGGRVIIDGEELRPHSPREAIRRGVGMVQQHLALVGGLTALENVILGRESVRAFGRLDLEAARRRAAQVAEEIGISLRWDETVSSLGVGDRQRLEIVRLLVREARVLILDEPTAVLVPSETVTLYTLLRRLAHGSGCTVIVVTHRLDEVREYADDVTVLRRGRLVSSGSLPARDDATVRALARQILGGEGPLLPARPSRTLGPVRLELRDVRRGRALRGVTLEVRAGQIVGIAGVEGNGQHELVRLIAGLDPPDGGVLRADPVAVVHEDRQSEGLVLDASVRENLVLGELARFSRYGLVDAAGVDRTARARADLLHVSPPDLGVAVRSLSGGNQQKVVVARAVARADRAPVLVFAHPTRGVDLSAARAVHAEIARCAAAGSAVLIVSADLGELRDLCDRVQVMAKGRIVAEFPPDAPEQRIGEAMLGAPTDEARA